MKASELVCELVELMAEHGDCAVDFEVYDRDSRKDKYNVVKAIFKEEFDESKHFRLLSNLTY